MRRGTSISRGFGFAEFSSPERAYEAYKRLKCEKGKDAELNGRKLWVEFS